MEELGRMVIFAWRRYKRNKVKKIKAEEERKKKAAAAAAKKKKKGKSSSY